MSFEDMYNDVVTLKKQTGVIVEGIKASVQKKKIFIGDGKLLIEDGDILTRTLSNGLIEDYLVIDSGFHEDFFDIKAHYQCEVEKNTLPELKRSRQQVNSITNNFNGPNTRYNHDSIDNSININNANEEVFGLLRTTIKEQISELSERNLILERLDELQNAQGTSTMLEKYNNFIQTLGNHITAITPFLPQLTQLLI